MSVMKTTGNSSSTKQTTAVRAACDKCHRIKIRCNRDSGSVECQRCVRLGFKCSYSAPLQMGRPRRSDWKGYSASSGSGSGRPDQKSASRLGHPTPSTNISSGSSTAVSSFYPPTPSVDDATEYPENLCFHLALDGAEKSLMSVQTPCLLGEPNGGASFDGLFMGPNGCQDKPSSLDFMALHTETDPSIDASPLTGASSLSESGQSRQDHDRDEELVDRLSRLQVKLQHLLHQYGSKQTAARGSGVSSITTSTQEPTPDQDSVHQTGDLNDIFTATVDFTDALHDQSISRPPELSADLNPSAKCILLSCYLSLVDVYDAASERAKQQQQQQWRLATTTSATKDASRPTWFANTATNTSGYGDHWHSTSPSPGASGGGLGAMSSRSGSGTGYELYLHLLSQMRIRAKMALDTYR